MKSILALLIILGASASLAGILPASRGGTGANLSSLLSAGGIVTSTASGFSVAAAGSQGQVMSSNGTGYPLFSSKVVLPAGGTVVIQAASVSTAGSQPLTILSGSTLTTTEKGAIESNGTHIWWTDSSGVRHLLDNSGSP